MKKNSTIEDGILNQEERVGIFLELLAISGYMDFCMAPGSRNTPIVLAADANPSIRLHVFHDERSMAFFALGMNRAGKKAVVCTTSGTAVANLFPAVIEAAYDQVPLVLLTADRPRDQLGKGANQTIAQEKIFSTHAQYLEIIPAMRVKEITKSIESLRQIRGPFHFNFRLKKPLEEVFSRAFLLAKYERVFDDFRIEIENESLDNNKVSYDFLASWNDFIQTFDAILVGALPPTLFNVQARIPDTFVGDTFFDIQSGSWACGTRPLSAEVHKCTKHAYNRVLLVGHRFTEHRVWDFIENANYIEQRKTRMDVFDPLGCVDHTKTFTDAFPKINEDNSSPKNAKTPGVLQDDFENRSLTYSRIVGLVSKFQNHYKNIFLGNSLTIRAFDRFRPTGAFQSGARVFSNRGASGIDGILASGMGVATEGRTLIVLGDNSFLYDLSLLADLKTIEFDATVLVVDNQGGRIFEHLPIAENNVVDEYYIANANVNIHTILKAFEIDVSAFHSTTQLFSFLNSIEENEKPSLRFAVLKVDPSEDLKDFIEQTEARLS